MTLNVFFFLFFFTTKSFPAMLSASCRANNVASQLQRNEISSVQVYFGRHYSKKKKILAQLDVVFFLLTGLLFSHFVICLLPSKMGIIFYLREFPVKQSDCPDDAVAWISLSLLTCKFWNYLKKKKKNPLGVWNGKQMKMQMLHGMRLYDAICLVKDVF